MTKWSRWRQLSPAERRVFIEALLLLPVLALGLRLLGLRRTQAGLARFSRPGAPPAQPIPDAQRLAYLVRTAAAHGLYRATCLPQALAVWWLLRRQGLTGELRIGVRKAAGQFAAHAWVEYQGLVLNDRPDVAHHFAPITPTTGLPQGRSL
ncbi:MAG: lasso peptide biosynthesis B2 protein [Anaerolineales bacterium]|nr:lasso peptide biosynthesis B2 protein [Anaerolineales bacterium]